jgi:hypothetical protein
MLATMVGQNVEREKYSHKKIGDIQMCPIIYYICVGHNLLYLCGYIIVFFIAPSYILLSFKGTLSTKLDLHENYMVEYA